MPPENISGARCCVAVTLRVFFEGAKAEGEEVGVVGFDVEQRGFVPFAARGCARHRQHQRDQEREEREESGGIAGSGEEQLGDGGEVDHRQRGAEHEEPGGLLAGQVGAGEGELAPVAEEAFEGEEGDDGAERGDRDARGRGRGWRWWREG